MKKKVLIIMPAMFIGGAERSLLGLLEAFDYKRFDVSLFLYRHEGEFLKHIPEQVTLLKEVPEYRTFDVPIKQLLCSRYFLFGMARILSKLAMKLHCIITKEKRGVWMGMQYTARFLRPLLPQIEGEYDLGIMFLGVADPLVYKVSAKKKIAWCHTDYDTLGPNNKMDLQTYKALDHLVMVSDKCKKKTDDFYPELSGKTLTIENILAEKLMRAQATEEIADMPPIESGFNLLSIGRFCIAKNFDNVPDICQRIREQGINIKWYIIGYGGDEQLIRSKIAESSMQDYVIMLGKKENPYPYIKACDLYVQPSRYEGKCVSVIEAQLLQKPVVITNYATSGSQLNDGVDGIVVPLDNKGCAEGIIKILTSVEKMRQLIQNCEASDYTNAAEVNKIYNLTVE